MVTIATAQDQALALTGYILSNETIADTVVYKEDQTIQDGLEEGFKSQLNIFMDELTKNLAENVVAKSVINKMVIKSIDKIFFSSSSFGVSSVMTTLKVVFNIADYVLGWQQSANVYTSLRVAG